METDIAVGSAIRVVVRRDELASRLALVARASSTRGAVQVLGGILLRASDGLLELEATDMELSLRTTVRRRVEGEGAIVVPAKLLGDVVRLLPAAEVTIAHRPEDGVATIESGSYSGSAERLRRRGLPAAARRSTCRSTRWSRASLLDTVETCLARGLARRVAARAHGHPRPLRGLEAHDGRDRLVPAWR